MEDHQVKVSRMDEVWQGVHMGWKGEYEICKPKWGL